MLVLYSLFLAILVKSDHVCDLETFKIELLEDLADNGVLDCLRIIEPPNLK